MNADTRQTLIGVLAIVLITIAANSQGVNGDLALVSLLCIVGLISPQALDRLKSEGKP
jgi:hypothetical protein